MSQVHLCEACKYCTHPSNIFQQYYWYSWYGKEIRKPIYKCEKVAKMKTFEGIYTINGAKIQLQILDLLFLIASQKKNLKRSSNVLLLPTPREMIKTVLFIRNGMIISYHRIQSYSK